MFPDNIESLFLYIISLIRQDKYLSANSRAAEKHETNIYYIDIEI